MKGKKTGGRQKGSVNKTTAAGRQVIQGLVDDYLNSKQFQLDVGKLDAKDRIDVMTKLAAFYIPKPQAIAVDIRDAKKTTIEERLAELSQEFEQQQ